MDYKIEWSPEAVEDAEEIAAYIRKDSPLYASQVVEELSPSRGASRSSPTEGATFLS